VERFAIATIAVARSSPAPGGSSRARPRRLVDAQQ
jgi:hypothetical protein